MFYEESYNYNSQPTQYQENKIDKDNFEKNHKKTCGEKNQPAHFRFSSVILEQKLVQTGLVRFGLVSIRFGFFDFKLIKPKPNRSGFRKF